MDLNEALKVIREECKKYETCLQCPLRVAGGSNRCHVTNYAPENWELVSDNSADVTPRLFI